MNIQISVNVSCFVVPFQLGELTGRLHCIHHGNQGVHSLSNVIRHVFVDSAELIKVIQNVLYFVLVDSTLHDNKSIKFICLPYNYLVINSKFFDFFMLLFSQ